MSSLTFLLEIGKITVLYSRISGIAGRVDVSISVSFGFPLPKGVSVSSAETFILAVVISDVVSFDVSLSEVIFGWLDGSPVWTSKSRYLLSHDAKMPIISVKVKNNRIVLFIDFSFRFSVGGGLLNINISREEEALPHNVSVFFHRRDRRPRRSVVCKCNFIEH